MSRIKMIFALVLLAACARAEPAPKDLGLPFYEDASFTPRWIPAPARAKADVHTIPAFSLTNQLGETVTQETLASKIYIADFFFTTCQGICLDMTESMARLQDTFAQDPGVAFVSHTVTPDHDTVDRLRAYGELHGVRPGKWHLLTGDRDLIYDLGRRHYFIEEDLGTGRSNDDFLHTENFVLIDGRRRIRGIYNGLNRASMAALVEDVRTLQRETN